MVVKNWNYLFYKFDKIYQQCHLVTNPSKWKGFFLISVLNTRLVIVFFYFGCTWIIGWFKEYFFFQRVDNLLTYFYSFLLISIDLWQCLILYFCSSLLMSIGSVVMSHLLFLQYSLDVYKICGKVLPFISIIDNAFVLYQFETFSCICHFKGAIYIVFIVYFY